MISNLLSEKETTLSEAKATHTHTHTHTHTQTKTHANTHTHTHTHANTHTHASFALVLKVSYFPQKDLKRHSTTCSRSDSGPLDGTHNYR